MTNVSRFTPRAEKAFDMLAQAAQVPLDFWEGRPFTWLTVDLREFVGLAPPNFWERCESAIHAEEAKLGGLVPQAVAVQIVGDDGSHATAWAVCSECLGRMGHSG